MIPKEKDIIARKFNAEKGFPFPVKLETAPRTVHDMLSVDFEIACRNAVKNRDDKKTVTDYITRYDSERKCVVKIWNGGRKEYVLK